MLSSGPHGTLQEPFSGDRLTPPPPQQSTSLPSLWFLNLSDHAGSESCEARTNQGEMEAEDLLCVNYLVAKRRVSNAMTGVEISTGNIGDFLFIV